MSIRDNHIFLPCLLVSGSCGAIFRHTQEKRRDNQSHGKETANACGICGILLWDSPETPRSPSMLSPGSYTCYTVLTVPQGHFILLDWYNLPESYVSFSFFSSVQLNRHAINISCLYSVPKSCWGLTSIVRKYSLCPSGAFSPEAYSFPCISKSENLV